MHHYIYILGTASDLCLAELTTVLNRTTAKNPVRSITENAALFESDTPIDPAVLMQQLGGTIKIATVVDTASELTPAFFVTLIQKHAPRRDIGVSLYGNTAVTLSATLTEVKKLLQHEGRSIRYVLPKQGEHALSSVVVKKQGLAEFICVWHKDTRQWVIGLTDLVQDSDDWSKRDYGRPRADAHSGMLPPKVARMMINLGLSHTDEKATLFDPFCGMGTVLAEGLMLGCAVIGSDLKEAVVTKARANLDWLNQTYMPHAPGTYRLEMSDAVHVDRLLAPESVDLIVTEPFLGAAFDRRGATLLQHGKPVTQASVLNTIKGLEKLYIGTFRACFTVLKPTGTLVVALPSIVFNTHEYIVKKFIDNCENLGYTLSKGPYQYARPQAVVKRNIYVFKKRDK